MERVGSRRQLSCMKADRPQAGSLKSFFTRQEAQHIAIGRIGSGMVQSPAALETTMSTTFDHFVGW
jgi:hypothetical protein